MPADQSVIRHDPVGIAGTKMVYKYQPVTGRLDADGKARVGLPDEFADKPLQIIINLPQDWSQIWMNLFAGLQLLGGAATLSVACAMEVGTMGVSTLVSLALVAWSADQMYAGANTLLTQQQTGTQAAALFEWAGMPPEYSELAAGMLPISTAMVKGVAASVINNQAIRSVTIHAVRHGDKLVNRSITFIGQKIKHRYVFRRRAGQQPAVANTLEGAEGTTGAVNAELNTFKTITNKFPDEAMPLNGRIVPYRLENGNIKGVNGQRHFDFIIDTNGNLVIGQKHHFLGNGNGVLAAGELRLNGKGQIRNINNLSGHYQPTVAEGVNYPQILQNAGLNIKGTTLDIYKINANQNGLVFQTDKMTSQVIK